MYKIISLILLINFVLISQNLDENFENINDMLLNLPIDAVRINMLDNIIYYQETKKFYIHLLIFMELVLLLQKKLLCLPISILIQERVI